MKRSELLIAAKAADVWPAGHGNALLLLRDGDDYYETTFLFAGEKVQEGAFL